MFKKLSLFCMAFMILFVATASHSNNVVSQNPLLHNIDINKVETVLQICAIGCFILISCFILRNMNEPENNNHPYHFHSSYHSLYYPRHLLAKQITSSKHTATADAAPKSSTKVSEKSVTPPTLTQVNSSITSEDILLSCYS